MELWHQSLCSVSIGTHLVPICLSAPELSQEHRVSFHEDRRVAERYRGGPLFGHTLYRAIGSEILGLAPHPVWVGVWWTPHPVPFDVLEIVARRPGPAPPGLIELIQGTGAA